jgi:hypothetical protein
MMRIFGLKWYEVTGEWRKLHNDELHDLHSSATIKRTMMSKIMRWAGHVARIWKGRGVYRDLVGKPEEKGPMVRPRRRWEDNIKIDLQKVGSGGWTGLSCRRIDTCGGHL